MYLNVSTVNLQVHRLIVRDLISKSVDYRSTVSVIFSFREGIKSAIKCGCWFVRPSSHAIRCAFYRPCIGISDVNKDLTFKAKDQDKD